MYPTSLVFMAYYTLDRHLDDPHQFTRDHQFLSKIKTYNMVAIFCSICLDFNIEYGLALWGEQGPNKSNMGPLQSSFYYTIDLSIRMFFIICFFQWSFILWLLNICILWF